MANANSKRRNEDFSLQDSLDLVFMGACFSYLDEQDYGASEKRLGKLAASVLKAASQASPAAMENSPYKFLLVELQPKPKKAPTGKTFAAPVPADRIRLHGLGVRWE